MAAEKERLDWVDGLRGIAVGLVVLDHTWQHVFPAASSGLTAVVVNGGLQGVSLFLVLSGFCLSYAYWRGKDLRPSGFLAGRVLRILPPYYAALVLVIILDRALPLSAAMWSSMPADKADIAEHILLIHNMTPNVLGLNGPFWSLGLEWQWYLLFPIVFAASVRRPRAMLAVLAVMSFIWTPIVAPHFIWDGATLLPGRLFEFAVGVAAARVVVEGAQVSRAVLIAGLVAGVGVVGATALGVNSILTGLQLLGLYWPLCGVAFAAVVLTGWERSAFRRVLASRSLSGLGRISYSVYLIHFPVIGVISGLLIILHVPPVLATVVLFASGTTAGAVFYRYVERPVMSRRVRAAVLPRLERRLRWCNRLPLGSATPVPEVAIAVSG